MRKFCIFVLLAITSAASMVAQDAKVTIQALNGKDGRPLKNQRLLIFGGETAEGPRFHDEAFDLTTDENGFADLKFDPAKTLWIQVWADYMTLCQTKPNLNSFSMATILKIGLSGPNNCRSLVPLTTTPGRFTVFARPSSLREKMDR
jgi:hypothetical protein